MKRKNYFKKAAVISLIIISCFTTFSPVFGKSNFNNFEVNNSSVGQEILLPPPKCMCMSLEKTIMRRSSTEVRAWTG